MTNKPLSIYVHWPFCESKCPYCDFNSFVQEDINIEAWIQAYKNQLDYFKPQLDNRIVQSIFFGGGTPSLMPPVIAADIIKNISNYGGVSSETEITFEANPSSTWQENLSAFKAIGFNRISLGVQSFRAEQLKLLGRVHDAKTALSAIELASRIFDNYSFDLIYALPEQTEAEWHEELELALSLAGEHLSCYQLTIEKGTPFYTLHTKGQLTTPEQDLARDLYQMTNDLLAAQGFKQYEISNYAKVGSECLHNLAYWHYDEYIGIGPGAHSRVHNTSTIDAIMMWHSPAKWLKHAVSENDKGVQNRLSLTSNELISEQLMMGLRLTKGISLRKLDQSLKLFGVDVRSCLNYENMKNYAEAGFLALKYGNDSSLEAIKLTKEGLPLHSYLLPRILEV